MAGSSYAIVDRLRGCYRAARTSPTTVMGEPASFTPQAGRDLNPYCLASFSGRAREFLRPRPLAGAAGQRARSGDARGRPALECQQFLLESLTGAMVKAVDRRLGALHAGGDLAWRQSDQVA